MNEQPPYFTQHQALLSAEAHPCPMANSISPALLQVSATVTFRLKFFRHPLPSGITFPALSTTPDPTLLKDLAGHVVDPAWDPEAQGITATLHPLGQGGQLLSTLGKEVLKSEKPPKIGFSADVLFKANGKQVTEITKVLSLDLVYNPARGGAFRAALQAWNEEGILQRKKEITMNQSQDPTPQPNISPALPSEQEQQVNQAMLKICSNLLETSLAASHLPKPVTDQIRSTFQGKIFTTEELEASIESTVPCCLNSRQPKPSRTPVFLTCSMKPISSRQP